VLLLVIVLLLQALTFGWINGEEDRKFNEAHYYSADDEIAKQKAQLDKYAQVSVEVAPPAPTEPVAPGTPPPAPVFEKRLHIPVNQALNILKQELSKPATPKT
jgi:hypothetical protein